MNLITSPARLLPAPRYFLAHHCDVCGAPVHCVPQGFILHPPDGGKLHCVLQGTCDCWITDDDVPF
jgi:hypothetical protein